MILTPLQIFEIARTRFPSVVSVTMTAIALRESAGNPAAFNGNTATGDRSYGLWQINMLSKEVAAVINAQVLKGLPESALFDAEINAWAAATLWAGKNSNLDIAWYINRVNKDGSPTAWKSLYQAHLPEAQAAALLSKLA